MNFKKANNITGWAVFFVAFVTYFLTREARGSLWDCGEFVATAKTMGLPHPPGAPLFVLLGRFFIILFGDSGQTAANAVNFMSALASAATILFLFWSITHFGRKLFVKTGEQLESNETITVMIAGAVGALAYTFSDSFWFSAVEGEVYALSSFFTALVFWSMLKWEHADESAVDDAAARARSDRWIVFLFFMMGLSIGVHILNLLTIPAIVMIYYYRRFKVTTWGGILAFVIGCIVTGLVQVAVIQYSMKAAGQFDVFFVNSMNMPSFTGFAFYFLAIAALLVWGIRMKEKSLSKEKMILWFVLFLSLTLLPFITAPVYGSSDASSLIEIKNQYWLVPRGSVVQNILKFLLLAGIATLFGYYMKATALRVFKLALWSYAFMMIGYFMYFTAIIRSNANPAIDMNNVENPINLVYYLSREQYGEAPLLYGPHFLADVRRETNPEGYPLYVMREGEMRYVKAHGKYVEIGRSKDYEYKSSDKQFLPRVWDSSNDQRHYDTYIDWLDLKCIYPENYCMVMGFNDEEGIVQVKYQDGRTSNINIDPGYAIKVRRGQTLSPQDPVAVKIPTYGDNLRWFFTYQLDFMYWRYFMWNFAGKQNDIQASGNVRDGNWLTGISFMDKWRLGDQSKMPDSIRHNKAHNEMYLLPFILGIIGCVFQFTRNRRDWLVNFLLFFFTSIAVIFYLNQAGNQPRERDYAYVGSFYVFAIWIGLAVVGLVKMARERADSPSFLNTMAFGSILTFMIMVMSTAHETGPKATLLTSVFAAILYAIVTAGITYVVRIVSRNGSNFKMVNIVTGVVCMLIPILMAQQVWDDHDRSKKTLAPDLAKDYLESCAPNAILFTFGDNDTYPLWYAQEVEGVRPDIRIINNSLLGIDWYINQLRYKINQADSVDVIWSPEQIEGHNREVMVYQPAENVSQETYFPLYSAMKDVFGKETRDPETGRDVGPDNFPVRRFQIPVDEAAVRQNKVVNPDDSVVSSVKFEIPKSMLQRNDLMILNIIAANNWKRPIYFSSPYGELGFGGYLRKDGLAYRLVPVVAKDARSNWELNAALRDNYMGSAPISDANEDAAYKNILKFQFGGADKKGVYFDEENRRHLLNIRSVVAEAAGSLADAGRKDEAGQLLDHIEKGMDPANMPYALVSRYNNHNQTGLMYLEAAYKAGKMDLANRVKDALRKDFDQQRAYYLSLNDGKPPVFQSFQSNDNTKFFSGLMTEYQINEALSAVLDRIVSKYDPKSAPKNTNVETGGGNSVLNQAADSASGANPDSGK